MVFPLKTLITILDEVNRKMRILVTRFEPFPFGSATAFRASLLCQMLKELGHEVTVLTPNSNEKKEKNGESQGCNAIRIISPQKFGCKSYDDMFNNYVACNKVDLIFRSTSIKHFSKVTRYAENNHIPIVYDSVEWYGPSNWRLGRLDPRYWLFQYLWRYKFIKGNGIIAISRLIESHFNKYIDNTVRIPTITDCSTELYNETERIKSDNIYFIFSGKLDNGKDRVIDFVKAMDKIGKDGEKIQLDIYGPSLEDIKLQFGGNFKLIKKMQKQIRIHGLVSQSEARKHCAESDFCIFFRPNRRSSNAGFPTKLGECMTLGTPAFCNDTGDISLVVKDEINGILIRDCSVDVIEKKLRAILNMSDKEMRMMRYKAREAALVFFDYHNYLDRLNKVVINASNSLKQL